MPSQAASTTSTAPLSDAGAGDASAPLSLLERARRDYESWPTRTTQPVSISEEIFGLCRLPSLAENNFVESVHGQGLYLLDSLNPEAETGIAAAETAGGTDASSVEFPVGATIVKQKLVVTTAGYELAALGLMIKREPGFDPNTGDWEFGYWEPEPGMLSGSEVQASCGGCHTAAPTDFVYLDQTWRLP